MSKNDLNLRAAGTAGPGYWTDTIADISKLNDMAPYFIDPTGDAVTEVTTEAQAQLDAASAAGGGLCLLGTPAVAYLIDTLEIPSNVILKGFSLASKLKLKAHNTTHHPTIRMGDASAAVNHAQLIGVTIDGNASQQTFAGEEWSPGVMIWGSDYNRVIGCIITNCKGDGVTIGHDSGRDVGSNGNLIADCEIYANTRQGIAITWGCENEIAGNRISGAIDLEINATEGECKNNRVVGNKGRTQTEALAEPRISDLGISLASLNTDQSRYFGNLVEGNHCASISCEHNAHTIIRGNTVVGSNDTQVRLLALDGLDDSIVEGNLLIANTTVATALTDIMRTRGCTNLTVAHNTVANETLPFHAYVSAYADAPDAANHQFRDNVLTGSGAYRATAGANLSESALYKLEVVAGARTLTRLSGPNLGISTGVSGNDFTITGAGTQFLVEVLPFGETGDGTDATTFDKGIVAKIVVSASNRFLTVWTYPIAAGAVSLTQLLASAGTGTFFLRIHV